MQFEFHFVFTEYRHPRSTESETRLEEGRQERSQGGRCVCSRPHTAHPPAAGAAVAGSPATADGHTAAAAGWRYSAAANHARHHHLPPAAVAVKPPPAYPKPQGIECTSSYHHTTE